MNIFLQLGLLFQLIWFLLSSGGWVVLLMVGLYLLWELFVYYNQGIFLASVKWITLSIDIPKENEQSFLAVEQIFAHLHSIHTNYTFGETYFHGNLILWLSLEIVSFGGQIKYLAYVPERYRSLFESAVYAQYPDAEINEVEDYIQHLPPYNPEKSHYDVWGTEFKLKKEDAYPIRTYRAFEHQASETIVDPLAGVLEALATAQPHELIGLQIIIRPTDDEWKEAAKKLVKELKGEPKKTPKPSAIAGILGGVIDGLLDMVGAGGGGATATPSKEQLPSLMLHLSPGERDTIAAIEQNIAKIGYQTKIRVMYIAPKEKFRKDIKSVIVGSFRQFDDTLLNGFKPEKKRTWTTIPFEFSEVLEAPYIRYISNLRKRKLVRFYKTRNFFKGAKSFILNIEELATIFHFPLITVKTPQLTKTEIKKSEAPINLPVQH